MWDLFHWVHWCISQEKISTSFLVIYIVVHFYCVTRFYRYIKSSMNEMPEVNAAAYGVKLCVGSFIATALGVYYYHIYFYFPHILGYFCLFDRHNLARFSLAFYLNFLWNISIPQFNVNRRFEDLQFYKKYHSEVGAQRQPMSCRMLLRKKWQADQKPLVLLCPFLVQSPMFLLSSKCIFGNKHHQVHIFLFILFIVFLNNTSEIAPGHM